MNTQYEPIISNAQQQSQVVLSQTEKDQLDEKLLRRAEEAERDYIDRYGHDVVQGLSRNAFYKRALLQEIAYLESLKDDNLKLQLDTCKKYLEEILLDPKSYLSCLRVILHDAAKKSSNEHKLFFQSQCGEDYLNAIHYAYHQAKYFFHSVLDMVITRSDGSKVLCEEKDQDGCNALHLAVKMADYENVDKLLNRVHMDVNSVDNYANTALMLAAQNGHYKIVSLLLGKGANLEQKQCGKYTALHLAIFYGKQDVVKLLLNAGAKTSFKNLTNKNILHLAKNNKSMTEFLIKKIALLPASGQKKCLHPYKSNVIHFAFHEHEREDYFFTALDVIFLQNNDYKAIFNQKDRDGCNALHLAIKRQDPQWVKFLVRAGMDANSTNDKGLSALHLAASYGNIDIIYILLKNDVNIDYKVRNAYIVPDATYRQKEVSVIHYVYYYGKNFFDSIIEKINERKDRMHIYNSIDRKGYNALHLAIMINSFNSFDKLLKSGMSIEAVTFYKESTLILASHYGKNYDIVKILVDKGANINMQDNNEHTALHYAAWKGKKKVVELLLERGAEISLQDNKKNTALHYAVINKNTEVVKLLLEHGAEITLQDNKKFTALHYAFMNKNTEVVKLLFEHGAKINARFFADKNLLDLLFMTKQVNSQLKDLLLDYVKELSPEEQTECLKNVGDNWFAGRNSSLNDRTDLSDLTYCIKYIQGQSDEITDENHTTSLDDNIQNIDELLKEIQFYEYIRTFQKYYKNFLERGKKYANATVAVKKLIDTCNEAKVTFFQSIPACDENLEIFKNTCKQAIETARPVLKTHRNLYKLIVKFATAIITFPISLPLYALGFFSFKTKSEELLDSFNEGLDLDPFNEDANQSALSNN